MNTDTGEIRAISASLDELGGDVEDLGGRVTALAFQMADILSAVVPLLRQSADNARQHATRTDHVRHTGRHRRDRLPPGCDW